MRQFWMNLARQIETGSKIQLSKCSDMQIHEWHLDAFSHNRIWVIMFISLYGLFHVFLVSSICFFILFSCLCCPFLPLILLSTFLSNSFYFSSHDFNVPPGTLRKGETYGFEHSQAEDALEARGRILLPFMCLNSMYPAV